MLKIQNPIALSYSAWCPGGLTAQNAFFNFSFLTESIAEIIEETENTEDIKESQQINAKGSDEKDSSIQSEEVDNDVQQWKLPKCF